MNRIRVAHIITRLCKGGAQENTFHTVRLTNRERFQSDLISGLTAGSEGSIESDVVAAGIDILRAPRLVREVAPVKDIQALIHLTHLFRARQYHIVHTHTSKAGFIGRLAAARAGIPIIVHTPHGNIFEGYFSRPTTRLFITMERYAARRTHRIIELTPKGVGDHLQQKIGYEKQYAVIFSGIDLSSFDDAIKQRETTRRALGVEPGQVLIGAVGRLEPVKGFSFFISAAERIAAAIPEARFVIAGTGSEEFQLRAEAVGLGERIQFLGMRHDVPFLMAALDIFVLTSLNEGMGRVLLEAGAAGVPAVASNVGGVSDVIKDGETGLLIPSRDASTLAEAVCALARDEKRRHAMGIAARNKVVPHFGLERMVRQIEDLYEELIRENQVEL